MKKLWPLLFLICLGIIILLPKLILVPLATTYLEAGLAEEFGISQVSVELDTGGWDLLFGRIRALRVVLHGVETEHLNLARVEIWGEDLRFNPKELLLRREFNYEEAPDFRGEILILANDLNDLFRREVDPGGNFQLSLEVGQVVLQGQLAVWNQVFDLKLHGSLAVVEQSSIRFIPTNFEVLETRVPPFLLELINDNYQFVFDLAFFEFPIVIEEITLLPGQAVVSFGGAE